MYKPKYILKSFLSRIVMLFLFIFGIHAFAPTVAVAQQNVPLLITYYDNDDDQFDGDTFAPSGDVIAVATDMTATEDPLSTLQKVYEHFNENTEITLDNGSVLRCQVLFGDSGNDTVNATTVCGGNVNAYCHKRKLVAFTIKDENSCYLSNGAKTSCDKSLSEVIEDYKEYHSDDDILNAVLKRDSNKTVQDFVGEGLAGELAGAHVDGHIACYIQRLPEGMFYANVKVPVNSISMIKDVPEPRDLQEPNDNYYDFLMASPNDFDFEKVEFVPGPEQDPSGGFDGYFVSTFIDSNNGLFPIAYVPNDGSSHTNLLATKFATLNTTNENCGGSDADSTAKNQATYDFLDPGAEYLCNGFVGDTANTFETARSYIIEFNENNWNEYSFEGNIWSDGLMSTFNTFMVDAGHLEPDSTDSFVLTPLYYEPGQCPDGTTNNSGRCEANIYTVTLNSDYYPDANGDGTPATEAATNTLYVKYGIGWYQDEDATREIERLNNLPKYTGYKFDGFYTGKAGTGKLIISYAGYPQSDTETKFTDNVTLYAKWTPNEYEVGLNGNGATSTGYATKLYTRFGDGVYIDKARTKKMSTSENPVSELPKRAFTVTYNANGGSVSAASETATSTFKGYYNGTTASAIQMVQTSGYITTDGIALKDTVLDNNSTLYAQWDAGSVTLPMPTRNGYTFQGWNTKSDGNGTSYNAGASYTPSDVTTLYAQWSQVTCTATNGTCGTVSVNSSNEPSVTITCDTGYSQNGGTNTTTSFTVTGSAGATSLSGTCSARTYTVTYACGSDASGAAPSSATATYDSNFTPSSVGSCAKTGYNFAGWTTTDNEDSIVTHAADSVFKWQYTANKTFTAKWTPNEYTIKYELNGGEDAGSNPRSYTIESDTITLAAPSKDGYTFNGWYNDNNEQITQITKGSTGNKTLYAKWTTDTYTITYELNDGENAGSNPSSYTIESDTITLEAPSKDGYTFNGWYNDDNEQITEITKGSTGDKTLYARWTIISDECDAGEYLAQGKTACEPCKVGNYCAGGTFSYDNTKDQGMNACSGATQYQDQTGQATCKTVNDGYVANDEHTAQTECGKNYYCKNGVRNQCPDAGETSTETTSLITDCFKVGLPCEIDGASGTNTCKYDENKKSYSDCPPCNIGVCNSGYYKDNNICVVCPVGSYCPGDNKAYGCPSDSRTVTSPASSSAATSCYVTCPTKTVSNGTVATVNSTIKYNGSAYPACTYKATCNAGYTVAQNNTTNPTCNINTYTITYELNDGENAGSNPSSYTIESDTITLEAPSKDGYTFNGWYNDDNKQITKITKGSTGDITLTAQWTIISDECDAGEYLAQGKTACEPCKVGNYCAGGTFSYDNTKDQGMNACSGAAQYQDQTGQATCKTVNDGYVANDEHTAQTECGKNHYCKNGVRNQCPGGYTTDTTTASLESDCYKTCTVACTQQDCPKHATCDHGTTTTNGKQYVGSVCDAAASKCEITINCDDGYDLNGTECNITTCFAGLYMDDNKCETCPAGSYCPGDNKAYECPLGTTCNAGANTKEQCYMDCAEKTVIDGIAYPDTETIFWPNTCEYSFGTSNNGNPCKIIDNVCVEIACVYDYEMINGKCQPCNRKYALSYKQTGNCEIDTCEWGYYPLGQQCIEAVRDCPLPENAIAAQQSYDPAIDNFGECTILECAYGYHLSDNTCVSNMRTCELPNGTGIQSWNEKLHAWEPCIATKCAPGYTTDPNLTNERWEQCGTCNNMYDINGDIAVSQYTYECEIATCMFHGKKYLLENNECRLICDERIDETGRRFWNGKECIHECNPGFAQWENTM